MSIADKVAGRIKKAAADIADDALVRRQDRRSQREDEAKEERSEAGDRDPTAGEVADLERRT